MTNTEKVERLQEYRLLQLQYYIRQNTYMTLRDKLMFPSATIQILSDMPTSHSVTNTLEQNYIMYESILYEMGQRDREMLEVLRYIQKAIDSIDNKLYQCILQMKYLDGTTWEGIAVHLHYSYKHVKRLHRRAVEKINL